MPAVEVGVGQQLVVHLNEHEPQATTTVEVAQPVVVVVVVGVEDPLAVAEATPAPLMVAVVV